MTAMETVLNDQVLQPLEAVFSITLTGRLGVPMYVSR